MALSQSRLGLLHPTAGAGGTLLAADKGLVHQTLECVRAKSMRGLTAGCPDRSLLTRLFSTRQMHKNASTSLEQYLMGTKRRMLCTTCALLSHLSCSEGVACSAVPFTSVLWLNLKAYLTFASSSKSAISGTLRIYSSPTPRHFAVAAGVKYRL